MRYGIRISVVHGARNQVLMAASAVDKVYDAVSEGKAKNVGTPSGYAIACACVVLLFFSVFVGSFVRLLFCFAWFGALLWQHMRASGSAIWIQWRSLLMVIAGWISVSAGRRLGSGLTRSAR